MNKKNIAGIILFTFFIGGILGYPTIKEGIDELIFKYRVESALNAEDYQRVHDLLTEDRTVEGFDWDYMALLQSKINLRHDLTPTLNNLIRNGEVEILQYVVDKLGKGVTPYLEILATVEGLDIDEYLRYEVANQQIMVPANFGEYEGALQRAMEIRGHRDVVDNIYFRHVLHTEGVERALGLYEDISPQYKVDVLDALGSTLLHQTFYDDYKLLTPEEIAENVRKLEVLNLPSEIIGAMTKEFKIRNQHIIHASYEDYDYIQSAMESHPFFSDNIYYKYYKTLEKLRDQSIHTSNVVNPYNDMLSDVLKELKDEKYQGIYNIDEVITVLEEGSRISSFLNVGNQGTVLYWDHVERTTRTYNIHTGEETELNLREGLGLDSSFSTYIELVSVSTGREFHLALAHNYSPEHERIKFSQILLDSNFKLVDISDIDMSSSQDWMGYWEAEQIEYLNKISEAIGGRKFYNPRTFHPNPVNPLVNDNDDNSDDNDNSPFLALDIPNKKDYHIYSVDKDTYTVIEYNPDNSQTLKYLYYAVYDKDTHELIYQEDLNKYDGLLGSCEENLYVATFIEDFIMVIDAVDKVTLEKTRLPFYTIETGDTRYFSSSLSSIYSDQLYNAGGF